jgi:F-type H+-transporting ATPase subunit b
LELSWTTFTLEIINFLVLVWILKRFLFRPVQAIIARRRAAIEKRVEDARTLQVNAEALQQQYQGRLAEWEHEKQQLRNALKQELESERTQRLEALQTRLSQERKKASAADERRQTDTLHRIEETALMQGARFATRLLEAAAGAEIETRLIDLVIDELGRLPDERIKTLRNGYSATKQVEVFSAFPLSDNQRQRLETALSALTGTQLPVRFTQQQALLAGLRITLGDWVLGANLKDELAGFAVLAHGNPQA